MIFVLINQFQQLDRKFPFTIADVELRCIVAIFRGRGDVGRGPTRLESTGNTFNCSCMAVYIDPNHS